MKLLIFWSITILLLILLYLLAKYTINKYFKSKKGRFDSNKSNYLSYYGIAVLLSAFIALNPKTIGFLINVTIRFANRNLHIDFTPFEYTLSPIDLVIYAILCFSVVTIIYLSYRHRLNEYQELKEREREMHKENLNINFPEQEISQSPFLHIRIKELFELEYKRYSLILEETKDEEVNKILYGFYKDDFHTIFEIIYCDVLNTQSISKRMIEQVLFLLENVIFKELTSQCKNPIAHYYYITESGNFDTYYENESIKCYTEDEFLNNIIDFKPYLKKLQKNFSDEKLFSAIKSDEDKKTLAETFIEPAFYIGNNKSKNYNKLYQYILKWIESSENNKHLVLLGNYGMGKTSFIKYIASKLSENYLETGETLRFPIFISLTNCSPIHGGIYRTIKSFVAENLGVDFSLFQKLIDKGKILFLLDAFDEMGFIGTKEQKFKQFNEIWQLATKNNKILLTGRPSYFPTEFELEKVLAIPDKGHDVVQTLPYAERLNLAKLDNNRIIHYIEKYYPEKARVYFNWIKQNKGLYELCKRPSMMHMIREMLEDLYEARSEQNISAGIIMKKYIEYWVNRQKSKKIQSAFHGNEASKLEFIESFFTELAEDFYLNDNLKARAEDIVFKINNQIDAWNLPGFDNAENLEGFQHELLTGYFLERENDEFKYVHKSFFDYFVSRKIIELLEQGKFNHPLMYKVWNLEIIDFVYDIIPQHFLNHHNIPALLAFSNSKIISHLKLLHFKLEITMRRMAEFFAQYILAVYMVLLPLNYFAIHSSQKANGVHEASDLLETRILYSTLIIIVFAAILVFIKIRLNKIKAFTDKSIILSVIKNEPSSKKLIKDVFSITPLTIKLTNKKVNKIVPLFIRRFNDSIFENIFFENCNFQRTTFNDCVLKDVSFHNSYLTSIKFSNCQLENVNFFELRKNKNLKLLNLFNLRYYLSRHLSKNSNDYTLNFSDIHQSQIDDKTISSLKDFIKKNKLNIEESIVCEEWLLNKIK